MKGSRIVPSGELHQRSFTIRLPDLRRHVFQVRFSFTIPLEFHTLLRQGSPRLDSNLAHYRKHFLPLFNFAKFASLTGDSLQC